MTAKCRCAMCGRKNADSNKQRNSYLKAGFKTSESGIVDKAHKTQGVRKRRRWEKRELRKLISE